MPNNPLQPTVKKLRFLPSAELARCATLVVLGLLLPALGQAVEATARREAQRVQLKLDKRPVAPSPFRLEIQRSDYRLNTGTVSESVASHKKGSSLSAMIDRHANEKGLDPALVHAVIRAESAYRPDAVSPKGAIGLMQVMPETGRRFGVNDLDVPERNVMAGTTYLRHLLDRFDNVPLALAAYNAGEGAVTRYGNKIPPYPETQGYVQGILRNYRKDLGNDALPRVYADGMRLASDDLAPYRLVNTVRY
ncbi:MAG: peptidoglycan N-acetylmuramoylhydrolase [Proteobacteria bacterium]|nr:peptidoglycan N-acetylmuramoylhydrolase [Pseudomonadota bacterium]